MPITEFQKLPLADQFVLYYKCLIKHYAYVNEDNQKITLHCGYDVLIKEFKSLDIDCTDKSITEIYENLKSIKYVCSHPDDLENQILKLKSRRISLLTMHLNYLEYYLYNYDFDKMPIPVRERFKYISKYSELWKVNKL